MKTIKFTSTAAQRRLLGRHAFAWKQQEKSQIEKWIAENTITRVDSNIDSVPAPARRQRGSVKTRIRGAISLHETIKRKRGEI